MDKRLSEVLRGKPNNYTAPFLWLHNEDDALILAELQRIYDCGIRAVCLESRTHEAFCREDWWSDCRLILDFCRAHGMKVWILDDKHFPSGYANGYYESHPELVQWNVIPRFMDMVGPVSEGAVYAAEWASAAGEEILGVFACRRLPNTDRLSGEIHDLSGNLADGYVYMELPEGIWRIVFLVKTRQGLSGRLLRYSDKLNPASTRAYIDAVYEPHYAHLKEYFGDVLLGFFSDEPGFGNHTAHPELRPDRRFYHQPWHESVREHFTALYGEDAMRNLLALWFDFDTLPYAEYRVAYMNFITDRYAQCFTGQIADWCHAHGVEFIGHIIEDNNLHMRTNCSAGHYFKGLRAQDMAGIDVVLHQIRPGLTECNTTGLVSYREMEADFFHYTLAKLAASLAHSTPHMKRRAMCEIFGAYGWAEGTTLMKYLTDHMLVRGINYFVPHAFSPKPNDPDCPPNFYASGENPQYKYFGHIIGYMNRVCHLTDGAIHQSTCAILYDAESVWSGEARLPLDRVAKKLYEQQLDYDILPPESLAEIDGNGCLNGERCRLLLVPSCEFLHEAVRAALKRLPETVRVAVVTEDGRTADRDFTSVSLGDLPSFVRESGFGDVRCEGAYPYLRYYHAVRDGVHLYMFVNEDVNRVVETRVSFADFAHISRYIRYDAFENTAEVVEADAAAVSLTLPPYHSVILLLGDVDTEGLPSASVPPQRESRTAAPHFTIHTRERDDGAFVFYKETDMLKSITGRGEMPRFSGTVRYTTALSLTARDAVLDLGEVGETAEVLLNGRSLGVRLFPPYRFALRDAVRTGENTLEILVTNTLGCRIHDPFSKFMLLPPSGLLGPIRIESDTV